MNISKQKKIVTILLAAMLVFVLCFSGLAFINVKAEEENNIYPSDADNGIYDAYTDTDIHNSININDYKNYYSNGVTLVDGEHDTIHMQVERSNEIVNFIPRELFKIEGITGYIGKEYGFLTDTFAVEGSDALHTIVLLFNIIINDNSYETKGHLKIRIAPVFQGEFAYITPKTEVIRGIYKGDQVAYDEEHYGNFYTILEEPVQVIQDHSIFRGYYRDPEFKNQITFISAEEKGPFTIYIKWDHHLQSYSRSSERKITDEDHMKQKSDKVNLYLPDPSTLEFSGFNSILVKIQVEMWEEDDGYQEMYLMDDSGKVLWSVEIEHVRGKKSGTHNVFTADIYIPLDWNEQGFNPLYLRYGGWGNGRDDWWTANVRVDIYLSMEEPKTYDKQHYVWNG